MLFALSRSPKAALFATLIQLIRLSINMQFAKPECNTRYFIFRENVEQIATAKMMFEQFPGILVKVISIPNSLKVNLFRMKTMESMESWFKQCLKCPASMLPFHSVCNDTRKLTINSWFAGTISAYWLSSLTIQWICVGKIQLISEFKTNIGFISFENG